MNLHRSPAAWVALALLGSAPFAQQSSAGGPIDPSAIALQLQTQRVELVELALPAESRPASMRVTVPMDGKLEELLLVRRSLRGPNFAVWTQDADGQLVPLPTPESSTYRGHVVGVPGSVVAATWDEGRLRAWVERDAEVFALEPVQSLVATAPASLYALHRATEAEVPDAHCAAPDAAFPPQPHDHVEPHDHAPPGGGGPEPDEDAYLDGDGDGAGLAGEDGFLEFSLTEIAFDADFEYFQDNGSVAATVVDIEGLLNAAEAIYYVELGICYEIGAILVRTSNPDPYTALVPQDLMTEFAVEWNDNLQGLERDIAHLCSGKNLTGNTIGWGLGGVVCDPTVDGSGYSLSTPNYTTNMANRAGLLAHELGHNWGTGHCSSPCGDTPFNFDADCAVMCACISGCTGDVTTFGAAATASINAFKDSVFCFSICTNIAYVDITHNGPEMGTATFPFNTFEEGLAAVAPGGNVILYGGNYPDNLAINQVVLLDATSGTASIGN